MSELSASPYRRYEPGRAAPSGSQPASLADVLDRILDKGLVIAGDISISLAQVELITIKIRLLLASADKAKEMGIDWWTRDESLSGNGATAEGPEDMDEEQLAEQNRALRQRVATLEERLAGLLQQPESTAAAPAPVSAADLLAAKTRSRTEAATARTAPEPRDTEEREERSEDLADEDADAEDADDGESGES